MSAPVRFFSRQKMVQQALHTAGSVHYQLTREELLEDISRTGTASLNNTGGMIINTVEPATSSAKGRFIVNDAITLNTVEWSDVNIPLEENFFHIIHQKITAYLSELTEIWVRDCYASTASGSQLNIRVASDNPWSNLHAHDMFLALNDTDLENFKPDWQIITAPGLSLDPEICGTHQPNATVISFQHRVVLIAGQDYTGENDNAMQTIKNFLFPAGNEVPPMHRSADNQL